MRGPPLVRSCPDTQHAIRFSRPGWIRAFCQTLNCSSSTGIKWPSRSQPLSRRERRVFRSFWMEAVGKREPTNCSCTRRSPSVRRIFIRREPQPRMRRSITCLNMESPRQSRAEHSRFYGRKARGEERFPSQYVTPSIRLAQVTSSTAHSVVVILAVQALSSRLPSQRQWPHTRVASSAPEPGWKAGLITD